MVIKGNKLKFFQDLLETARSAFAKQHEWMRRWQNQYEGNEEDTFDGAQTDVLPSMRWKMTYELVEASKSLNIPFPRVDAETYTPGRDRAAKRAERLLAGMRPKHNYVRINDVDEMHACVYGTSVRLHEWDDSVITHDTVGDVKITMIQPDCFFPQPGVREISECEYVFLRFRSTPEDVARRYDMPELRDGDERNNLDSEAGDNDDTVWVYVCYYKDDDDNICQYIWSGDVELLHVEDYYNRKVKICKKCGKVDKLCSCEHPDLEEMDDEYEELTEDIVRSDGSVIPAMSPVYRDGEIVTETVQEIVVDEMGMPMLDYTVDPPIPMTQAVEKPKMAPTKIRYYKPRSFPVTIHKNVSKPDSFWGASDCEAIRPEQQEVNKLLSRIHKKVMKATVIAVVPEDVNVITNDVLGDVVKLPPNAANGNYGNIDTTPDVTGDLLLVNHFHDQAMQTLGITPSYLGQADATAQSGKAKALQIQQASGRMQIKRALKNAAYAESDRVIFELHLAYDDDKRPLSYVDDFGTPQSDSFSRYDYCVMDPVTGEWYVDDRYIFSTDTGGGVEQQRETLWEMNASNYSAGLYGPVGLPETLLVFWRAQEKAHYPDARDKVEYFRALVQAKNQMQQQAAAMAQQPAMMMGGGMTNG